MNNAVRDAVRRATAAVEDKERAVQAAADREIAKQNQEAERLRQLRHHWDKHVHPMIAARLQVWKQELRDAGGKVELHAEPSTAGRSAGILATLVMKATTKTGDAAATFIVSVLSSGNVAFGGSVGDGTGQLHSLNEQDADRWFTQLVSQVAGRA